MSDVAEKWGEAVAERGFAQVPNYLLLINQFLADDSKLSPVELGVLLQLVGSWWKKEDQPFPSIRRLALLCGCSERQAQRAISSLSGKGIIQKSKMRRGQLIASNSYDLNPLVELLKQIAISFPNINPRNITKDKMTSIRKAEKAIQT